LPQLRVATATRPLATGSRFSPGSLLFSVGVSSTASVNLVDLDTDRYFDKAGLQAFAAALLAQESASRPSPPAAAWTIYRSNPGLRDTLASLIATRAGRNHLVAAMAAVPLSIAEAPVDPRAPGFDAASLPSGIGD